MYLDVINYRHFYQIEYTCVPASGRPPPRHGRWTIYEKYYDSQKSGQGAGLGFWTDGLFPPTNLGYHISTPGSSRRPGRGAAPVYSEWDPPGQKVPRGGQKGTKIAKSMKNLNLYMIGDKVRE